MLDLSVKRALSLSLPFLFSLCLFLVGTGLEAQTNLIKNGTFENQFSNWSQIVIAGGTPGASSIGNGSVCGPFHTGPAATFNVFGNKINAIEQTVTIPGNSTANLKFKVWGQLDPTRVTVKILTQGGFSSTLDNFIAPRLIQGYTFPGPVFTCTGASFETKTYDMTNFTGQTVTVHLEATSTGFDGTFAMIDDVELNAISGGGIPPVETPIPGSKRQTATQLFCNRSGPTLGTADCTASVADQGAPPRILPTGTITFAASQGLFPASASCQPQQTQFSPGIGACNVQFAVPSGFPIGVRFPIDATYEGNSTFEVSSTSHFLIQAGCVSLDPAKPCPNSVGISFGDFPKIKKDKFTLIVGCGSKDTNPNLSGAKLGGSCSTTLRANVDIREILEDFTYIEWSALAAALTDKTAKDAFSRVALEIGRLSEAQFNVLKSSSAALDSLAKDITNNKLKKTSKGQKPLDPYFSIATSTSKLLRASSRAKKKKVLLSTEIVESAIKADTQKAISLKLNSRMKKIATLLRNASILLPVDIVLTVKQKNRRGTAKITESVTVAP